MGTPHPLGLALSGGGFRAAAFHVGVLKRLRELGLLREVDVISTVSGGSITGAFWVYWQAIRGDTLGSDEEWDKFETSLIGFLKRGIRGRAMWRGLFLPMIAFWALAGAGLWWFTPASLFWWPVAGIAGATAAYVLWHYRSGQLLEKEYDAGLFGGATMQDLAAPGQAADGTKTWPRLIIDCTSLNTGHPVVFTHDHPAPGPVEWEPIGRPRGGSRGAMQHGLRIDAIARRWAPVPMPSSTRLATAVTASSCFPGAFTPLRIRVSEAIARRLGGYWYTVGGLPYSIGLVDGGVFDNQGTYALMDAGCRSIVVSDASAALRVHDRPSTWLVFPSGKGVIFRSQNIIYDRVRDLGEKRLMERCGIFQLARSAKFTDQQLEELSIEHRWVQNYCYLQLNSKMLSGSESVPCLSEDLNYYVARIRTDLDRFSDTEIAALVFHGYSVTELSLRGHNVDQEIREWLGEDVPKAGFRSADAGTNLDWANISKTRSWPDDPMQANKQVELMRHLEASGSRLAWWRRVRRFRNHWRDERHFCDPVFLDQPRAVKRAVLERQRTAERRAAERRAASQRAKAD